ncbi:MAG: SDR family oxidoreductase [Planctomycetota bacterium]|jgi:NADH dehydrogenase
MSEDDGTSLRPGRHVVTGAFGYTGKYIARRLLDAGAEVCTLTGSPDRDNPFGGRVKAHPLCFDDSARLTEVLRGAAVLYNTYWIRFPSKQCSFAQAFDNSLALFRAAKEAGVQRVVHISITNPSQQSPLEYFRRKAQLEAALADTGLSHAIVRPALLFGGEDILVNNIAWMLRRFPILLMPGLGRCRLRPIHVDDLAALAVEYGAREDNCIVDAVGPESFTYRQLIKEVSRIIGCRRLVIPALPAMVWLGGVVIGKLVGDVVLTRDELKGLMGNLLSSDAPPLGTTRLTDWARAHADTLGKSYHSELARRKDRLRAYKRL